MWETSSTPTFHVQHPIGAVRHSATGTAGGFTRNTRIGHRQCALPGTVEVNDSEADCLSTDRERGQETA
jgi:hypothetical protein